MRQPGKGLDRCDFRNLRCRAWRCVREPLEQLFPCLRLNQRDTDTLCGTEGEAEDGLLSFKKRKGWLFNH